MSESYALLRLPGCITLPSIYGRGSPEHLEITDALADAMRLTSSSSVESWDGPMHPSASTIIELSDWGEISAYGIGGGVQFSFSVVAPRETELSRNVLTVRDRRIDPSTFDPVDGDDLRKTILELLGEWSGMCTHGNLIERTQEQGDGLGIPDGMILAKDEAVATFGAMAHGHGLDLALGEPGAELMWHMRSATSRSAATLVASANGNDEATFDDETMSSILGGMPPATIVTRDVRNPVCLTVEPFEWRVRELPQPGVLEAMRRVVATGAGGDPGIIVKRSELN